jgi:aromatic-L-amino-acid decarboxylase
MMPDSKQLREEANRILDLICDYFNTIEQYPVKSQVKPGEIIAQLPKTAPLEAEPLDSILNDLRSIILPGMTHWQSPNFFAYFPANSSLPSLLAEMVTAALGAQCMKWETSPAATELEEQMMHWLKKMTGLPEQWQGVIQDSASSASLVALLSAREKYGNYHINTSGFSGDEKFRVYASTETHSSIEKGVKIAGMGWKNLVKIDVDEQYRMRSAALQQAIENDIKMGMKPICVIATLGTTGSTAIDPLQAIAQICEQYDIWLHVDAAYAGSALILPEYRWMIDGIEGADSFVFNPHKWLFTNFDCSVYFVKDKAVLLNTLAILPEYLRTRTQGQVNDYCDWGIPLGRRFRALKLWFVLRMYGVHGLQQKLRFHISLAKYLEEKITTHPAFELLAPRTLNLLCFRYRPTVQHTEEELNSMNEQLLHAINDTGKVYMTHTKLKGKFTLRMLIGQTNVEQRHVAAAWELIVKMAKKQDQN